jgi:signal transduction histidine kinase
VRRTWLASEVGFTVVGVALTVVVLARGGGVSVLHVLLSPLVGWSFGVAGVIAYTQERWRRVGILMLAVGFAWFVHLVDWTHVPVLVSASAPLRYAYAAVFAHLLLAFPTGHLGSRWLRALVTLGYLDAVGVRLVASVLGGSARVATPYDAEAVVGIVLACLVMAVLGRRAWSAGRSGMARLPPAVGYAAVIAFAALVANVLSGWFAPRLALPLWVAFSAAFAAVPFGFLASLLGVRLRRAGVTGRMVRLLMRLRRLADTRQSRDVLADVLRDPYLDLAFWVPDRGGYVDDRGGPVVLPGPEGPRVATLVERDGRRIGALVHGVGPRHDPELIDGVAAAAGLALDHARLDAELRARLAELQASRARLVETAAAERRRIERNLHDGAQQRLVSVAFALGLAQSRLSADPTGAGAALVEARAGLWGRAGTASPAEPGHPSRRAGRTRVARCPLGADLDSAGPGRDRVGGARPAAGGG